MDHFAVFVDAGYLFAQGSVLVSGTKRPRPEMILNNDVVIERLRALGPLVCPGVRLLRIYWYDAPPRGTPTLEQTQIAELDDTKLRLGMMNAAGEQKGVDSLIVTDLIDLARQKSICDAVVLSGDEDVRIGVQVAQSYGVRVHLLGISPARGSQSIQLRFEADTTREWDLDVVSAFLSVRRATETPVVGAAGAPRNFFPAVDAILASLTIDELVALKRFCEQNRGLPPEQDGALLKAYGASVGGRLFEDDERRLLRQAFRKRLLTPARPSE